MCTLQTMISQVGRRARARKGERDGQAAGIKHGIQAIHSSMVYPKGNACALDSARF